MIPFNCIIVKELTYMYKYIIYFLRGNRKRTNNLFIERCVYT